MSEFPLYSAAEFRRRALNQTGNPVELAWREHGDHLLNRERILDVEGMTLRDAAVLVPVIDEGDDARVIFTQRTTNLRKHSGQIAFPGGAIDPEDASPEAAAMREAEEEIGLANLFVEPVARLPHYLAATGFRITPILAVVKPGFELTLSPTEVEDAFEVPLSFLMDPTHHMRDSMEWKGSERHFYRMPYGQWMIWGITAGIVRTLYERLYA
ncbi:MULTISPECIES: CoA pyrophosphatase [Rhizobium]|uniref:CoA pyrophosphatase n=1 Tax=Rhizobium rhododendri TaxID=2506430 RepID=A0ABY8ICW9_9HYPH|nr:MULTISPECIES: CoA pyrophosphatase [Rhizobium]MBO9099067.1 CoA pyrophosphatase [Rhizobium sp. L58/93]MBO9132126.1 CoA pyrophosphatase [Rhizobium sp. B209b/85]MBO9169330.1 CoA pyrophosphatase [Rhizobium sp. L245/93]MBO9185282.1 CoA pyrophosphatase [Rhizobium sp. E27B/91]MBZ5758703.1 CoA pyrophosphatase [Rhizobium sp. VS19-DR96]